MKERNKPTKSFIERSIEEIEKEAFQEGNGGLIMKMWIARDKNGNLFLHRDRPYLSRLCGVWDSDDYFRLEQKDFPEVTFENSPMEVELKLIEK